MPTPCNVFMIWGVQMVKSPKHEKPKSDRNKKAKSSTQDNPGPTGTYLQLPHDSSISDILTEALRRGKKFREKPSTSPRTGTNKLTELYHEVREWIESSNRPPSPESNDFEERGVAATLDGLRRNASDTPSLRELDKEYGMLNFDGDECGAESLNESGIPAGKDYEAIRDELESRGYKRPESITTLNNVRSAEERRTAARERPAEIAKRVRCVDFNLYRSTFKDAQKKLADGIFTTRELEGKSDIKKDEVYIYGGLLAYISEIGKEFSKNHKKNARLRVIFENGMESNILKTTFLHAMSEDPRNKVVTQGVTGWIYVLQSLSEVPEIRDRRDLLHKIGFTTTTVDKRLSTAHLQSTYLYAPVNPVKSYEISTVHPSVFEKVFHAFFAAAQAGLFVVDGTGKKKRAKEWFEVPLEAIAEFVELFLEVGEGITDYRYDEKTSSVVKR